jgi:hypothetical protein
MVHMSDSDNTREISRRIPARSSAEFCPSAAEELEDGIIADSQTLRGEEMLGGMKVLGFAFVMETEEATMVC